MAILALTGLILGFRFSINFATEASVDAAPLNTAHDFPVFPEHQDGPITVTIEYWIASEDRERFRTLMEEVQAACRRNGAFQCRLDESLDSPGLFRLDYMVSTWAEYLRQKKRMTVDESQVFNKASELHAGDSEPVMRHFLSPKILGAAQFWLHRSHVCKHWSESKLVARDRWSGRFRCQLR